MGSRREGTQSPRTNARGPQGRAPVGETRQARGEAELGTGAKGEGGARAAAWGLVSQQPRALLPQSRQGGQLGDTGPATPLRPRAPAAPPLPPAPARSARPRRWHGVTCHCPGCTDLVGSREWGQRAACAQCRGRRAQCGGTGAQCGGRSPQQPPLEAPRRECHPRARHSGFPSSSSLIARQASVHHCRPAHGGLCSPARLGSGRPGGRGRVFLAGQAAGGGQSAAHRARDPVSSAPLGGGCRPRLRPHTQAQCRASETSEGRFEELRIIVNFVLLQKKISGSFLFFFFLTFFPPLVLTRTSLNQLDFEVLSQCLQSSHGTTA